MAPQRRRTGKNPPKYSWILSSDGLVCYKNPSGYQTITKLWESAETSGFTDARLAKATKDINAILGRLERSNKDPQRKLSFIEYKNRHFLVWARYGFVGPDDDDAVIIKALKLKAR